MLRPAPSFIFRLLLLLSLLVAGRATETGLPLLRNFTAREYEQHNQTWSTVQDSAGVLYFGNRGCVLRYDGQAWRALAVPDTSFVRGVALAPDGTLYAGGVNQLGFFHGEPGSEKFVSLLDKLPADRRDFRDIWGIAALPDGGLAFVASRQVMIWRRDAFVVIPTAHSAVPMPDSVFDNDSEGRLLRLEGDRFVTVCTDPLFKTLSIEFVSTEKSGDLIVGSRTNGLFRVNSGRVAPLPTAVDAALRTEGLRTGTLLDNGALLLASARDGVLLLDRNFQLLTRVDTTTGLSSPTVRAITPDREGGLWLCHNSGVTRLEWPSAVTVFNEWNGLDRNTIHSLARHEGVMYAATSSAVYFLNDEAGKRARFQTVQLDNGPLSGAFRELLSTPHGLLVVGSGGAFLINDQRARLVLPMGPERAPLALCASRTTPDRIFIGGLGGLQRLRRDGDNWIDEGAVPGTDVEIRSLVTDPDGSLWGSTNGRGFIRVTSPDDAAQTKVEFFSGGQGLPERLTGISFVERWRDRPLFCTGRGLFLFDAAARHFTPLPELGALPAGVSIATQGTDSPDHLWLRTHTEGAAAGPWRGRRIHRVTGPGRWEPLPYVVADLALDARLLREETTPAGHVLWIGGSDLLARVDLEHSFASTPPPRPLLRGNGVHAGQELPHARNNVAFEFPAPSYRPLARLEYQTQLIGFEDAPAAWSAAPARSFTNLPEGDYVFEVRARNSDVLVSAPAVLAFSVLPAWWNTAWAYAAYGTLAGLLVTGIVRLRSRQLRVANERLEALVTARTEELRTREQQLLVARDGAEAANRAKTAFLANMSHELRTPLNAVLGYAQLVLRDPRLTDDHRRRLNAITQGGEHLLQMINEVLDLSKIEADKVELAPRACSLPRLLAAVSEMFQLRASQRNLAFGYHQATPLPETVLADEGRLRQVLINLLENAVKFTSPGGRVDFEVGRSGGAIRFSVRDTGTGIAAGDLERIFKPFHQSGTVQLQQQGAGLGLAISQRLVGLMGGVIRVESTPGQGSCFHFEIALPETDPRESASPFPPRYVGYRGANRRILVVDDEETNRHVLREMLEPLGFIVTEAVDGVSAVAAVEADEPDLVLMDIRMPKQDGLAAAEQIRALPRGRAVRIVAVSASVFSSDREEAVARGCDDFLPKPFRESQLLGAIGRLLQLDWIEEAPLPAPAMLPPADAGARPARDELEILANLAAEGDILTLRARLDNLRRSDPRSGAWLTRLDALAAEFQMTRLSEEIARALDENHPAR